jgi:hypothetical protein
MNYKSPYLFMFVNVFTLLPQEFKNFLRKLRGEQMAAPLKTLDVEPNDSAIEELQASDPTEIQDNVNDQEQKTQKDGCGGPGLMCCCPCGALKGGADGESKKRMEKV